MSNVITRSAADSRAATDVRTAVASAGLAGAVGSGAYISGVIVLNDLDMAEAMRAPLTITASLVAGLAFLTLCVTLAGLAGHSALPRWALSIAAAGCGFIAMQAWAYGTFVADAASKLGDTQFERLAETSVLLELMYRPMGVVCLVGFAAVAIIGWRRRAMSRGACVVLALAGVAALLGPFPPVGLLSGLALAWTARSLVTSAGGASKQE